MSEFQVVFREENSRVVKNMEWRFLPCCVNISRKCDLHACNVPVRVHADDSVIACMYVIVSTKVVCCIKKWILLKDVLF